MNNKTNLILVAVVAFLLGIIGSYLVSNSFGMHGYGAGWGKTGMMGGNYDSHHNGDEDDHMFNGVNERRGMGMMGDMNNMGGMTGMMDMMSMMVSSEREFIEGMIPHHQEAVDTAKEVLARGATTDAVKQLVENIVTAQEAEIASMKNWYETWYSVPYTGNDTYRPMMRDLKNLSGAGIDVAFLEDMIMHHMGAIMMARSVQPFIEHDEIANLASAVISTQSDEIQVMQSLLQDY